MDTDDDVDDEILREQGAVAALKDAMELSVDEMGDRDNLTEAIDVALPWRESVRIAEHHSISRRNHAYVRLRERSHPRAVFHPFLAKLLEETCAFERGEIVLKQVHELGIVGRNGDADRLHR